MKATLHFLLALTAAALLMLAFRSMAFTIYTVNGSQLEPELKQGDRVMVNRWSYGLRTGGRHSLFSYARICRDSVERGDIVAFDSPIDSVPGVFICRCKAVPGDTVLVNNEIVIVPGRSTCANEDCYWLESVSESNPIDSRCFGFVNESNIIGRVCMVVYSHDETLPFYDGYRENRLFLLK